MRNREELSSGELDDFWAELEFNNDPAMQELNALAGEILGSEVASPDEITNELLQRLWDRRDSLVALRAPVKDILFPNILDKLKKLDVFCSHLDEVSALDVSRFGSNIEVKAALAQIPLVFIDYYLGPELTPASARDLDEMGDHGKANAPKSDPPSVKRAKEIAKEIYKQFASSGMPLIILMSSDPSVEKHKEEFLDESGLLSGMFYFVPKDDLANKDKLFLKLGAWAMTMPTGSDIQLFVNALDKTIEQRGREFIKEIKKLSIEDYAYIQKLSLQEEGHPLGDYMLWL